MKPQAKILGHRPVYSMTVSSSASQLSSTSGRHKRSATHQPSSPVEVRNPIFLNLFRSRAPVSGVVCIRFPPKKKGAYLRRKISGSGSA